MLARTAYRPASSSPLAGQAAGAGFRTEVPRQTVKANPAVRVELSDAARSALLGLQEIALAPPELFSLDEGDERPTLRPYEAPGSRVNLSV